MPPPNVAAAAATDETRRMFGTIARVALLRILPRRLIPLLTAWQVIRMLRDRRSRNVEVPPLEDRLSSSGRRRR